MSFSSDQSASFGIFSTLIALTNLFSVNSVLSLFKINKKDVQCIFMLVTTGLYLFQREDLVYCRYIVSAFTPVEVFHLTNLYRNVFEKEIPTRIDENCVAFQSHQNSIRRA